MLGKPEHRRDARKSALPRSHARDALTHAHGRRQFLAVVFSKFRFMIKEIDVRWPAGHEEIDYALCLWREVSQSVHRFALARRRAVTQQRSESRAADAGGGPSEEVP